VLVTELLHSIAQSPSPYGSSPLNYNDDEVPLDYSDDESVARACIISDSTAPYTGQRSTKSSTQQPQSDMDFKVDFGSSSGFKSHAKKKKTTVAPAASLGALGDNNENKKDDTGTNGTGGDDGLGGNNGGDAGGAGGGGDDNNGGNDDDDAWGFSTGKKDKKKPKKKQDEEDEEERKRKEEEEAMAAAGGADPLSWANDANGEPANDDWNMSWGGPKKKETKKKKVGYRTFTARSLAQKY